jgi:signal transduction histidine kinase/ActR/RegA family two-component response regulator
VSSPLVVTGAIEKELGWASSLVIAWLELVRLPETEATREAREQALRRFDQYGYAAALVDNDSVQVANAAWRNLFGSGAGQPATWARQGIDLVLRTQITLHLPDVIADTRARRVWLAATLTAISHDVVAVVCLELSEAVIARELVVASDSLVWSGSVGSPAVADYVNQCMRDYVSGDIQPAWQSAVYPDDLSKWNEAFAQAVRRRVYDAFELRLQRADGQYRWHTVRVIVANSNTRWFGVARDCHDTYSLERERTELLDRVRAARVEAEDAHRVKDQVLAAVSHELRAPVTTIMLWERVLRDPASDATARDQALDAIHQSATTQSRIVADLLDVARAFSGKLYVDFRSVALDQLVSDAVKESMPAAHAKRIKLTHDGAFAGHISGDVSRLRQVIDNLLSNAIKFTDVGGRIAVTTERKGREVMIVVEDNGAGIAKTELKRIFEPFNQAHHILARREGGLGLGLAIARQIVELHHGSLTAYSDGLGHGARFTLTLPIAGQPRAPSPPAGVVSSGALNAIRVLVIDDDERVRNALALLLDRAGAIVDRAESANAAREQMSLRTPHVIVCDLAMPDEDGFAFIRSLRASGNQIPAIALTAYASRADAEQAVSAGFDIHVAKPVDFHRLVASLAHVIESRRRTTSL